MKEKTGYNIKIILKMIGKLFVAGIISVIILSVSTYLYDFTGIHITNKTGATDYVWQQNQKINNLKEGFAYVRMDENGFNNTEVPADIDILLMGSSHMEAYQVASDENTGFLLNKLLSDKTTYNIGVSGHTIYRITDNIESALSQFSPSRYVIIETSTIALDMVEMEKVITDNCQRISSYDSGIMYYLQKVPAFKPLYNQLENWIKLSEKSNKKEKNKDETDSVTELPEGYEDRLKEFLSIVSASAEKAGISPIIFYAPLEKLDEKGNLIISTEKIYSDAFEKACLELEIGYIDMTAAFMNLYKNKHTLAHGFSNTAVGVGHLNKFGHQAVAEVLADYIKSCEER